jgi:apolipoprotein N-acyltransferase
MNSIQRKHRYLLSVLSGLMLVLSFPYTGSLTFLVFVALVPLLLIEAQVSQQNYRSSKVFIHALVAFSIYNIGATWWVWNASPIGAAMAFVLNSIFMAFVFLLFHYTKKFVGKKEGYLSLFFYWIAFEFLHYHWELSWPWLHFGNVFSITPWSVQWYSYTGVLGGTFWVILANLLGKRIVENRVLNKESWRIQTPLVWSFFAIILVPMILSIITYLSYKEQTDPVEVVVIQPNIDPYNEKFNVPAVQQVKSMFELAESYITPETAIVVTPETAVSEAFLEEYALQTESIEYVLNWKKKKNIPLVLTGASTARLFDVKNSKASRPLNNEPGFIEYYNTSLLIDERNELHFVHKSLLVPGVEIMPFSEFLPFLEELSIENGGTSGSLGIEKEPQMMSGHNLKLAPLICYESISGGILAEQCRKGAEAVFVITNDGWWGDTPGYKQHMSFARLRAIESRRSVVRSANTGISCVINQRGDVLHKTKWWEEDAFRAVINKNNTATFYTTYGDIMGRSFSFVSVLLLLLTFVRFFKRNYMNTKPQ